MVKRLVPATCPFLYFPPPLPYSLFYFILSKTDFEFSRTLSLSLRFTPEGMPGFEELQPYGIVRLDPVLDFMHLEQWTCFPFNERQHDDGDHGDDFSPYQWQKFPWQASNDLFMVGFVMVNVVGIRHYSGTVNGREAVSLVREPLNQFDGNAIKVLNLRHVQVGYIEAPAARVLAPLIDSCLITVEGIICLFSLHFLIFWHPECYLPLHGGSRWR